MYRANLENQDPQVHLAQQGLKVFQVMTDDKVFPEKVAHKVNEVPPDQLDHKVRQEMMDLLDPK